MRLALALAVCCLTAGCLGLGGGPADPTGTLQFSVTNGDDRPYDVGLSVVPDEPTGVAFTYANGTTRQRPIGDLTGVSPAALTNVTDVRLLGANVTTETFRVPADSGIGTTVDDVEPGASVWVVVRTTTGDSRVRAWAQFSCRRGTESVRGDLTITPDGAVAFQTTCGVDATADG
ncbi:hypothetical protein [Haloarcula litorea]|uniref:hypothetical protein n=1 Tax=Haloarcula litorea TaxID=3032579 RepID=UPI0023E7FD1A|nr:hypothetical protein [Halomicroarcula sp. GDY20]